MNESTTRTDNPLSTDEHAGAGAVATEGRRRGREHVTGAARGRADHRSGAQRRAVPGNGVPADRGTGALARRRVRGRPPAASARHPAADASPKSSSRARMICIGSAPRPTCCATSRLRTARITRSARACSAFACCSSSKVILSSPRACSSSPNRRKDRPGYRGARAGAEGARGRDSGAPSASPGRGRVARCRRSRARRDWRISSRG